MDALIKGNDGATCAAGESEPQPLARGDGFTIPGTFLDVKANDLCRSWDVPLVPGLKYNAITVEFDLELDHWASPLFNNITSLRRSAKKRNERVLYYGLILRGDRAKTVLDLGNDVLKRVEGPWREGGRYHIVLSANLGAKKVSLSVYQDDQLVHSVSGRMTAREIRTVGENIVRVDFSSPGIGDGAYFPPANSKFSNLTVTAIRR
jgi:hypothetical protein